MRLLDAAATTHGEDIETSRPGTMAPVMVLAARRPATEGLSGDLTPLSIAAAVITVPEKDLPGASGLRFRRTGEADPATPAVRVRSGLVTTLDDEGQPRVRGGRFPTDRGLSRPTGPRAAAPVAGPDPPDARPGRHLLAS